MNSAEDKTTDALIHRTEVTITNSLGLHLRPASQLVKLASEFPDCEVFLIKGNERVNAKSIMGVIMLAAEQGSELVIEALGDSAKSALQSLETLIRGGFGEE